MSPTLTVQTADLADAASSCDHAGERLWSVVGDALNDAAARTGMAGDDPAGLQWADEYQPAAVAAAQAAQDVINGAFALSGLLSATALNYANADAASTTGERHAVVDTVSNLPAPTTITLATRFDGVGGGPSNDPVGWSFLEHFVKMAWPNGHQDRLLRAAGAWHRSADALDTHATDVELAAVTAIRDDLPEWHDIRTACWSLAGHLREVARAHRSLARACEQFAHRLDIAHGEVEHEILVFAAESAAIQAVGDTVSLVTFGLAQAPTQAVEAARMAATVAKVVAILTAFGNDVRDVLAALPLVTEVTTRVSSAMHELLSVRIVIAEVAAVPGLRVLSLARDGRTAASAAGAGGELGAVGRLTEAADSATENFVDRAAIREAVPSHWDPKVRSFLKSASGKCKDFRMTRLPDGSTRIQYFAPADNPGYGKLFVQVVGEDGQRVAEYKDTLGPHGLIERKWVYPR